MLLNQQDKKRKEEEQGQYMLQNILIYAHATNSEVRENSNSSNFQTNSQYRQRRISSAAIQKCYKSYNNKGALCNSHVC